MGLATQVHLWLHWVGGLSIAVGDTYASAQLTLVEVAGSVSVHAVEEDAEQVRAAGYHIIGGHKPERDNGQDDAGITCGVRSSARGDMEQRYRIIICFENFFIQIIIGIVKGRYTRCLSLIAANRGTAAGSKAYQ